MMDAARASRLAELMQQGGYQALVCRIPQHVLMLTGYAPILGNTFCVVSPGKDVKPEVRLAAPQQEADLLPQDAAVEIKHFTEETLQHISSTIEAARQPVADLLRSAGLSAGAAIGYEGGAAPIAPVYTQVGIPGPQTLDLLREALPGTQLRDATALLDTLSTIKTAPEIACMQRSIEVAIKGFEAARAAVRVGASEAEVAAAASAEMLRAGYALAGTKTVQPHAHVMAGPRAADAYRAFNLTANATIQQGDTVSVQIEIGIDGYWAELTRVFFAGEVSAEWRRIHTACAEAQQAALGVIREGITGREADTAARTVLQYAGFGNAFKHGLGHGCGFQAINHAEQPILHPVSETILRDGMAHNMEPAVYLEGKGSFRLNDDVLVRQGGNDLLSAALPRDLDWLVAG